jgi:hypothetical protein
VSLTWHVDVERPTQGRVGENLQTPHFVKLKRIATMAPNASQPLPKASRLPLLEGDWIAPAKDHWQIKSLQ